MFSFPSMDHPIALDIDKSPATDIERSRQIRAEQVATLHKHTPALLISQTLVMVFTVFVLWGAARNDQLLAWGAAVLLMVLGRAWLYWSYARARPEIEAAGRWGTLMAIGSGVGGVIWGMSGVLFFLPGALDYQLFLLFVLAAMGTGAASASTIYKPAFYAFFPVIMVPLTVMMFLEGERNHVALGFLSLIYCGVLMLFARIINATLANALNLRFENIGLVRQFSAQKEEAERANIAKSKFLAAASHDLRQPLHALTLFSSALEERTLDSGVRKIVDNISASVRALESLFNTLLDISKLDAGVLQVNRKHFRLQELFDRLTNDYAPPATRKGLSLRCENTEEVVKSDPVLLEQILRNFVSNAVRYTRQGEVVIRVRKDGEPDMTHVAGGCLTLVDSAGEQGVVIEVKDSGIGIPADQLNGIFQEFVQLGNPERDRNKGLGLGLAIVERIAHLLQHRIEARSCPGAGSLFAVVAPRGDVSLAEPLNPKMQNVGAPLTRLAVVVIDDEHSIREGMRTLLESWGCQVVSAGSDEEALQLLAASGLEPDVILADYRLREERTGVEAIRTIHEAYKRDIPAVLITGDTGGDCLGEAEASGIRLLHKPVQPAQLRAFLRNVEKRRLQN